MCLRSQSLRGLRGFNEQIFDADEQVSKGGCGPCPKNASGPGNSVRASKKCSAQPVTQSGRAEYCDVRPALLTCPGPSMAGAIFRPCPPWDQMKPRTVYEKAVQDFTETARRLARLDQHFQQASFAEFEMLMGLDDEVLKGYGLPKPMVERALLEVYQIVVLDQQR